MAQQTINIGTTANDGTGDPLRTAFDKVNDNFTELYTDDAGDVGSIIAGTGISVDQATGNVTVTNSDPNATHTGEVTGATALTIASNVVDADNLKVTGNGTAGQALTSDGDGTFSWTTMEVGDITAVTAGTGLTGGGNSGDVTLAVSGITTSEIGAGTLVIESEGIGSNDNDTTIPTSAAVKDYVDGQGIAALTATDGGFVVGNGSAFVVETGSTARDSIGLGTSGHIQFHCLGVGQAASTNNGQIDATTLYASGNIGKDSGDYITWTTDTQMDFYVNGNNKARLEADGDLQVAGDVVAASTAFSDERLKENIKKIENPLEAVSKLNGVTYDWKANGKSSLGVIAQDVQKVFPDLVKEVQPLEGDEKRLTVNYDGLIGVLIESVKELKAEVETLKNK